MTALEAWNSVRLVALVFAVGLGGFVVLIRSMPFEWMLAKRYLALLRDRSARGHLLTLSVAMVWLLSQGLLTWMDRSHTLKVQELRESWGGLLEKIRLGAIILTLCVEVFLRIVRKFTVFSTISTYGLFLGTGALVIVLSVMSGFENDLKHKILGINAHINVTRANSDDQPFTAYREVRQQLLKIPGVLGATPYISNEVMIASQSNLSGVVLKGVDPDTDGSVTDLEEDVTIGELKFLVQPDKLRGLGGPPILRHDDDELAPSPAPGAVHFKPADPRLMPEKELAENRKVIPGVVIGRELAKNLRLYLGDDVNVVSPLGGIGPQGPIPKSKPFRVAGIFFSGMFEYDSKYIYMSIPAAQKFLGMEDEVTGLELKVADSDETAPVVAAIQKALGAGYEVQDWQELNRNLFSALKLEKIAMFIVLCFIVLVAAFSIIANGIMLVMEKGQEIAILKSMGATDMSILTAFMMLGIAIGGLGVSVGVMAGVAGCLALGRWGLPLDPDVYYITKLPVRMNPNEVVLVALAALVIGIAATLYPAWSAARLRPVEGLREGSR
jgi:lipoprotein-releasing system permease protein